MAPQPIEGPKPPELILRRPEVERRTGLKRSAIYDLMSEAKFPKALTLSGRAVGWLESEIFEWQRARIAERDKAASSRRRHPTEEASV
jgi:prophage regulatory protein